MNIDWSAFTPYASLAGGVLIGLAAALFILLNERIAGISGVLGGLLGPVKGDVYWRVAFLVGLVAAPAVYTLFIPVPSLALVMLGAIAVGVLAFSGARRRATSFLGLPLKMPTADAIDRRLVGGGLLFGVGWGIAGSCPVPALVAVGMGEVKAVVFVVAMLLGMGIFELRQRPSIASTQRA